MERTTLQTNTTFNNAQIEILKMFSRPMKKKDLLELKKILIDFLSKKIDDESDKIWEKKKLTQVDLDKFLNTHIKRKK